MSAPSRLKVLNRRQGVPDKYRYTHPEDGWKDSCFGYESWLAKVYKHKLDNGYPIPADWREIAEDQLCRILPPGFCAYEDGRPPESFVDARMGLEDVMNGTRVFISWVQAGVPLVEQELAEARAATCAACYMNMPAQGCGICQGLSNLVEEVARGRTTKADQFLASKACVVCKCVSRAHIWLPIENLKSGVSPEMMQQFPAGHCWKRKEIEALAAE